MKVSYWVAREIVSQTDIGTRVRVLEKFVAMAAALQGKSLCNMHSFIAVMTGLQWSYVSRLRRTHALLLSRRPDLHALLQGELAALAEPGSGLYHNALARVNGFPTPSPCVPFLGSFLSAVERAKGAAGKSKSTDITTLARAQGRPPSAALMMFWACSFLH